MHPILSRPGRLGLYLLAWAPLTAILAGLLVLSGSLTWLEAGVLAMPLALVYAFLCLSSWYLCQSFPIATSRVGPLAVTLAVGSMVAGALWLLGAATFASLLALLPPFIALPDHLSRAGPVIFLVGVLLYLLIVALHYALIALEAARDEERRQAELRELARAAELMALKEQLNPHFLFNCLNSISALTVASPSRAREMCVLLSDFLRKTLGLSEKSSITLREEIALLHNYLAIEKVRFGDRLAVEEDIDEGAGDCPVPPLLLQPLVENAVKHGVAKALEGGAIRLKARRSNGNVTIDVENAFDPESPAPTGAGLGLQNVKRRLAARWGDKARLSEHRLFDLFRVEITIPVEAASTPG
jgi:two-component system sensor histidine kinase AlgZ